MFSNAIEEPQRRLAKLAGFLYLFTILGANLTEFLVRARLSARGDALQAARNIAVAGELFRAGIGGDLITLAGNVALIAVLFLVLRQVNRTLALIAAFWWLIECAVAAVTSLSNYAALLLLTGTASMPALKPDQLPELARLLLTLETAGNRVAALFFGLGSTMFCYLWFKSRYIPRALAAWGIISSLVPAIIPFTMMMLADMQGFYLRRARAGLPIIAFEVIIGFWLLVRGIRPPEVG